MRLYIKYMLLILGTSLVFYSILYYGTDKEIYFEIFRNGIILGLISLLLILFSRDDRDSKVKVIAGVILVTILFLFCRPLLIKQSYKSFLDKNLELLDKANNILTTNKIRSLTIYNDTSEKLVDLLGVSQNDAQIIKLVFKNSKIISITKENDKIFYNTYGLGDNSKGVYYLCSTQKEENLNHLKGNWYY